MGFQDTMTPDDLNAPGQEDAQVVFTPSGKRGRFPIGTSILECARKLGVDLDSVCGGRGICGRCQITVGDGEFSKHGIRSAFDSLTPISEPEKRFDKRTGLKSGRRLGCHTNLMGDVVIDVPPESQVHKQVVRKRAEVRDIKLDPAIRLHYVEIEEPDMDNPLGDFERLELALQEQWNLYRLDEIDIRSLRTLQTALRKGGWKVTVAVHREKRITMIWPGFHDKAYGVAFDVGSTTIAAHLCDLSSGDVLGSSGLMNPQIRFGEDLMSRISYIMMNPGGERDLIEAIRNGMDALASEAAAEAGIHADEVLNVTIVGNPIMHHLVLGIDPTELGGAPFALAASSGMTFWATEIGLTAVNPDARVYMLPCIAGHVGADTAGVVLSEGPHLRDEISLIVDVGTNAEIVLGNSTRLLACSSPTGPAFEGAQISSGQRAAPGAIERFRIDKETLRPRYKVIGSGLWSDEEGFEDEIKATGVTGICGSGVIEAIGEMYLSGVLTEDGVIDGAMAAKSARIEEDGRTFRYRVRNGEPAITITQNDIRAIQLAKAALYAGCRLLMDEMEIEEVDRIVLAGAFGSHIDVRYAMLLGMIPDCDLDRVYAAGNAAGTGARIALLDQSSRDTIEQLTRSIVKIETATAEKFQRRFVEAMALPHKTAPYPNLSKIMTLPEKKAAPAAPGDGGRRRRG